MHEFVDHRTPWFTSVLRTMTWLRAVRRVKPVVTRPRPQVGHLVITATGFSFASGHATQTAAAYGAIALVVRARYGARIGRWAIALAVVVAATVGLSRVYLGVHWPSDVVAGWLLGTAWLWCCATSVARRPVAPQ